MWDVPIVAFAPTLLGVAALLLLRRFWTRIKGSTLQAPLGWLAFSIAVLAIASSVDAVQRSPGPDWIQYLIAISTYCPLMALMGARRPHQRGWTFIVITFWVVLALPAIQVRLTRAGDAVEASAAWTLLLAALLFVALVTVAATVYRIGGLLAVIGQAALTAPWVGFEVVSGSELAYWGRVLLLSGVLVVLMQRLPSYEGRTPFDRSWLRFRDHFGGLWALRIAERLNAFFVGQSIPLRLRMRGLCDLAGRPAPEAAADAACWKAYQNLIRRFVASDWVPNEHAATMSPVQATTDPPA